MFESHITDGLTATAVISGNELKSIRADVWASDEMLGLNLVCNILSATTSFTKDKWIGPRTAVVFKDSIHYRNSSDGLGILILCNPKKHELYIDALVDTFVTTEIFSSNQLFDSNEPGFISIVKEDFLLIVSAPSTRTILESFYSKSKLIGLFMSESYFSSPFGDNISPAIALADNCQHEFNNLMLPSYKFRDCIYA